MLKSYKAAKALYQKGRYKAVQKITAETIKFLEKQAQQLFDLDYDGYTGRKTITVDASTYKPSRTGAAAGSVYVPSYNKRITVRDSQVMNLSAWKSALAGSGAYEGMGAMQRRPGGCPMGGAHDWNVISRGLIYCKKCDADGEQDPETWEIREKVATSTGKVTYAYRAYLKAKKIFKDKFRHVAAQNKMAHKDMLALINGGQAKVTDQNRFGHPLEVLYNGQEWTRASESPGDPGFWTVS